MDATLANITLTTDYKDIADSDLIIEAAVEEMHLKIELFKELDALCKKETIIATNTSSLSITGIAANISRPCHVIGMHFFNPATVMKLVEIIKGQRTSQEVFDAVFALCHVGILADGVASRDDIDAAMKLGANHPMGPLALADLIGLDVCLAIMEVLHSEFGDDKYRPHPLLRKMVRAGLLGRKTGEGFYKY